MLARGLRRWPRPWFAASLVGLAVLAGSVGVWLAVAPGLSPAEVARALDVNPGGWLMGLAILRGTAHADPDDEPRTAVVLVTRGLGALIAFWLFASVSGLAKVEAMAAASFAASLTLVSAGLLSVGLARLADLDVEAIDRGARRRWLALLLGVSGGAARPWPSPRRPDRPADGDGARRHRRAARADPGRPGQPDRRAAHPAAHRAGRPARSAGRTRHPAPRPIQAAPSGFAHGPFVPTGGGLDLTWLLWLAIAAAVTLVLVAIGLLIRRPPQESAPQETAGELREAEPFTVGAGFRLPRLRSRRPPRGTPATAVEAYRFALLALAGRAEGREPPETPREHARRIAAAPPGADLGRLAVDYQLAALGGRTITAAEERRAFSRWRRILRSAK